MLEGVNNWPYLEKDFNFLRYFDSEKTVRSKFKFSKQWKVHSVKIVRNLNLINNVFSKNS